MNFVVSLVQLFFAALLHLSAVKCAHIPKEGEKGKNEVVPFMEVFNKSLCRTRETLVDIYKEYPDDTEHTYHPSCVVVMRCAGCCGDESLECVPTETRNVTLEVIRTRQHVQQGKCQLSFTEHTRCECKPKQEVKVKKEKKPREGRGKGQKRKRKRERDTAGRLEFYTSTAPILHTGSVSLLVFGLMAAELLCSAHCEPCSERRKRFFVQDPITCKCSCKFTQLQCKSRQPRLELNERTCRCDKPRR